jgi:hypothetical protein
MNDALNDSGRTCMDVARELVSQPELLAAEQGLMTPETKQAIAGYERALQRYTGARSTQDEERMLRVGALRLLGASDREIEAACGVTRRTIPLLLVELGKTGRITPLKQRLAALTGDNAERANLALRALLDRAVEGHESIELAGMIKAVATAVGITTEKILLLTGQATEIVETRVAAGREAFEAWWRDQVKPAQVTELPPTDSVSDAGASEPEQIRGPEPTGHGQDTPTAPDPAAAEPAAAVATGGEGVARERGGRRNVTG